MTTDFRIQPLADRVVVKPADREAQTEGGIFLPDTASEERPVEGTLLAVGEGQPDDHSRCQAAGSGRPSNSTMRS